MPIKFRCQSCRHKLRVPSEWSGKVGRCPKCKGKFEVPLIEPDDGQSEGPQPEFAPVEPEPAEQPAAAAAQSSVDTISTACTACGHTMKVRSQMEGKKGRCPKCQAVFQVQSMDSQPAASQAAPARQQPVASQPADDGETWFLLTAAEEEFGPITKKELDSWVEEGLVTADSQVFHEGDDAWRWAVELYPQLDGYVGAEDAGSPASLPLDDGIVETGVEIVDDDLGIEIIDDEPADIGFEIIDDPAPSRGPAAPPPRRRRP